MTTRTIMTRAETTAWMLEHVASEPAYFLGSVPVHVVPDDHCLAPSLRGAAERRRRARRRRGRGVAAIEAHDGREGRPPRMLVIATSR
jgi:hypothetical protein